MSTSEIAVSHCRARPVPTVAGFACREVAMAKGRPGPKPKPGPRYPGGKLKFQNDFGLAYGAMQRLARTSPTAAADALSLLSELARLTGRCVEELTADERRQLRSHSEANDKLARQQRDRRASYPLGILYMRGLVSSASHYAGRRYAALFVAAVRPVGIPSILADLVGRGAISFYRAESAGTARADIELAYRAARAELMGEGLQVATIVDEVVVYELGTPIDRTPRFRCVERGLRRLADHFERADSVRRREA